MGTSALGSVSTIGNNIIGITGLSATSAIGSLQTKADAIAYPTTVAGTGEINFVLIWGEIVPGVTTDWSVISDSQSPNWQEVA